MKLSVASQWVAFEDHFQQHANQVEHLRHARADAVACTRKYQTNEDGTRHSQFERSALIERHCELFCM